MEAELSGYEEGRRSAEKFIALVDKYQNFEELTTYMLNEFVEKIVVHERDRKGSIETTQEVEIYFNFIGRYLPPHFGEVKMTPEEIEEMEKREARKDRLHQNYLRRKANGKQQEYYERTKAKKKAELDAKKEEIRQEDIAKGIIYMVLQTIGGAAVLSGLNGPIKDFVLIGNLTKFPQCHEIFPNMEKIYGVRFHIPPYAEYRTAIGAALAYTREINR